MSISIFFFCLLVYITGVDSCLVPCFFFHFILEIFPYQYKESFLILPFFLK